jgi:hypothetical protein
MDQRREEAIRNSRGGRKTMRKRRQSGNMWKCRMCTPDPVEKRPCSTRKATGKAVGEARGA